MSEPIKEPVKESISTQFLGSGRTIYEMHCKKGPINVFIKFLSAGQREAEEVGRAYCEKWGFRFIWVDPFLTDLNRRPALLDKIYGAEVAAAIETERSATEAGKHV